MTISGIDKKDSNALYQRDFALIDELLQRVEKKRKVQHKITGSDARLFLSSCRNHYFVINALYADIKRIMALQYGRSLLQAMRDCAASFNDDFAKHADRVGALLDSIQTKEGIWTRAFQIKLAIDETLDDFPDYDRDRMHQVLYSTTGTSYEERLAATYTAISIKPVPVLEPYYQLLQKITVFAQKNRPLADAAYKLLKNLHHYAALNDKCLEEWQKFVEMCRVHLEGIFQLRAAPGNDSSFTILLADGQNITLDPTQVTVKSVTAILAALDQQELVHRTSLSQLFRPNAIRRELPSVFEIALPLTDDNPISRNNKLVAAKLINLSSPQFQDLHVACPGFGIPLDWYETGLRKFKKEYLPLVKEQLHEVFALLQQHNKTCSIERKIRVVLFPEYFVPRDFIEQLGKLCLESGTVAIYGLEAEWGAENSIINQVGVDFSAFGEEIPITVTGTPRFLVDKQEPSLFEPALQKNEDYSVFNASPIGTFGVLICSDVLEYKVVQALYESRCVFVALFVLSMNPSPDDFEALLAADSIRLHVPIVVANNCVSTKDPTHASSLGTALYEPKKLAKDQSGQTAESLYVTNPEKARYSGCEISKIAAFGIPETLPQDQAKLLIFKVEQSYQAEVLTGNRRNGHTYIPKSALLR